MADDPKPATRSTTTQHSTHSTKAAAGRSEKKDERDEPTTTLTRKNGGTKVQTRKSLSDKVRGFS